MEPSILMNLTRGRIVHLLLHHGPATATDISAALALSESTVRRELDRLAAAGFACPADTASPDAHPEYLVDASLVAAEIAHVRHYFSPWL